jgi:hypothetical protein
VVAGYSAWRSCVKAWLIASLLVKLLNEWAVCLRDGSALSMSGLPEDSCQEAGLASVCDLIAELIKRTIE